MIKRGGLEAALWEIQPQLLADAANQIRIEVIMRSGQRQFRDPALAMDRQKSVSLAPMMACVSKQHPRSVSHWRSVSISINSLHLFSAFVTGAAQG